MNLIIVSIVIFMLYIASMVCLFNIPWSISNTYYLLEEKRKGLDVYRILLRCWWVPATRLAGYNTGKLSIYLLSFRCRTDLCRSGCTVQRKPNQYSTLYVGGYLLPVFSNLVFCGWLLVGILAFLWFLPVHGRVQQKKELDVLGRNSGNRGNLYFDCNSI